MPRTGRRQNGSLGEEECAGLDQATRRRLRNRLSQRNFRERKSMYIKELEERSKVNAQSESERNLVLVREAGELRAELLRLRSKVLKLSASLSAIGSEIGKTLNMEGVDGQSGDQGCQRGTSTESEHDMGDLSAMVIGLQSPDTFEGEQEDIPRDLENTSSSFPETISGQEKEHDAPAPQEVFQPEKGAHNRCMDIDPASADDQRFNVAESHSSGFEGSVPVELRQAVEMGTSNGLGPHQEAAAGGEEIPDMVQAAENAQPSEPFNDSLLHEDLVFEGLDCAYHLNPELWMISSLKSYQVTGLGSSNEETSEPEPLGLQHQNVASNEIPVQENLTSLPMVPSQVGCTLPPGLFPAPKSHSSSLPLHSRLSDHIETLEQHVRCFLVAMPTQQSRHRLYQYCTTIMSLSIQNAWPSTYPVWFKSQVPELIWPIILWRIHPTSETHNSLLPNYKPTELQLTVPHSAIIDWIPYAPLRDRVLLSYNGSVALDRMMCDILNSYVIEVDDVSRIIHNAPSGRGYFGVWNVFRAIHSTNNSSSSDYASCPVDPGIFDGELYGRDECTRLFDDVTSSLQLPEVLPGLFSPATSTSSRMNIGTRRRLLKPGGSNPLELSEILGSPDLALRLAHDIRLYAAKSWRLDKNFFKVWPELKFDGYENIVAQGRSYRLPMAPPDAPMPITDAMAAAYREAPQTVY